MRTVLAAAAAGALIMGSAAGAMAAPKTTPAKPSAASSTTLQTVSIKGHKTINLAEVSTASTIALRAKVRTKGTAVAPATVSVKLGVYDKKVNGTLLGDSESDATPLANVKATKRNTFYSGSATILTVWGPEQVNALVAEVAANGKAYICVSSVVEEFDKYSKQTRKRLNTDVKKKPVRDCVKVVNVPVTPPPS